MFLSPSSFSIEIFIIPNFPSSLAAENGLPFDTVILSAPAVPTVRNIVPSGF
jgi:hypothetical protein